MHHTIRCHNPAIYCSLVGREATDPMAVSSRTAARRTDHPHYASVAGPAAAGRGRMPHHVIIPDVIYNGPAKSPGLLAGYLGAAYDPFVLGADPSDPDFRVESVGLPDEVEPRPLRRAGRRSCSTSTRQQRQLEQPAAVETHGRRSISGPSIC